MFPESTSVPETKCYVGKERAIVQGNSGTAQGKIHALTKEGVMIGHQPKDVATMLKNAVKKV